MKLKSSIWLVSILLLSAPLQAEKVPPFIPIAKEGAVYIYLTRTPSRGTGFNVYRAPAGTKDFVKLNSEPVVGEFDPYAARDSLGAVYDWVARAVRGENEFQTFRRVRRSEFTSTILSFLDPKVARVLGRLYVDTGVEAGRDYVYRIAFVDWRGKEGPPTPAQKVTVISRPPKPPTGLKAKVTDAKATVTWNYPPWRGDFSDLALRFNVYRKDPGEREFKRVNREVILRMEGVKPSHTDVWLENGKVYLYYVTAVDIVGQESQPSDTLRVIPKDNIPPSIPTGLVAIPEGGKVTVAWRMNLELDLSHYDIFRSTGLDKAFVKINKKPIPGNRPVYVDTTVQAGQLYFYRVSAFDRSGNESKRSNAVSALPKDTTPPDPPSGLSWKPRGKGVFFSWKPSKAKDLRGYYVYRGEDSKHLARLNKEPIGVDTTWFFDKGYGEKGLLPGGKYYIAVSAVDRSFNESKKTMLEITMPDTEPPMPPPTLMSEVRRDGTVRLNWSPSPSLDVEKYRLYRGRSGEEPRLLAEFTPDVRDFLDKTVAKGETYTYTVTAVDRAGNESPKSPTAKVIPRDTTPPSSPRKVVACITPEGVLIIWGRVMDEDLAGFNVYRSNLPTGIFKRLNAAPVKGQRFLDKTGTSNNWYRVHAVDTSGNESLIKRAVRPRKCGEATLRQ